MLREGKNAFITCQRFEVDYFFRRGEFYPLPRAGILPLSAMNLWSMISCLKHCGNVPQKRWSTMKTALEMIREYAEESARLSYDFLGMCASVLDEAVRRMARSLAGGGKILVCGNGESAAVSQHMTGEILGRFLMDRPSIHAVVLNVGTSILTSVGNDYGHEDVFARQTSGLGCMASMGEYLLNVLHCNIPQIQEMHEGCMHLLCRLHYLFNNVQALSEGPKGV